MAAAAEPDATADALQQPTPSSLAQQLCRRVLSTARKVDSDAKITSVSRWDHDHATLVRVRASDSQSGTPFHIVAALRQSCPLARVSLVENVMEGTTEAQMLIPSCLEQRDIAHQQSLGSPVARRVRAFAKLAVLAALLAFVALVTANATRR